MKWFFILLIPGFAFGGTTQTPILPHQDANDEKEFSNVYQNIGRTPSIFTGTTPPASAPSKVGDEYVNTSSGKVYFATSTLTSGGWAIVN